MAEALRNLGLAAPQEFPWANRSERGDWRGYYTRRAEEAVYRRYRWAFDQGFYPALPGPDGRTWKDIWGSQTPGTIEQHSDE